MDPTLWIADSGTTVHTLSNKLWAKNQKEDQDDMIAVKGNGQKENVTTSSPVFGNAKDQKGNSQGTISLSDVMYLPNGKYNHISFTKIMRNGWKLEGNDEKMALTFGNNIFNFDIKINTTHRTLFAVSIKHNSPMSICEINVLNLNSVKIN